MITTKEKNEMLNKIDSYSKDLEFLSRKSRDLVFIAGVLCAGAIYSVIAFNELIAVSWVFTNIIMIYVCFKMWEYHSEQRKIHNKIHRLVQKISRAEEDSEAEENDTSLLYLADYKKDLA